MKISYTGKVNGDDEVAYVQKIAYCCPIEDEKKRMCCELVSLLSACTQRISVYVKMDLALS